VRLLRADIAGLAAIGCFEGCGQAIVVDALRGFGPAGSLHALDPADFAADAARAEAPAGFHGAGLGPCCNCCRPPSTACRRSA
jgi:hypothetical protein